MTSAALIPLGILSLLAMLIIYAVRSIGFLKPEDKTYNGEFCWLPESETYAIPSTPLPPASEPPPTAEVIRMPVRLYVVQGGRR